MTPLRCMGCGGVAPVSGKLHLPATLPAAKSPPVPLGWAPESVWKLWRVEIPFPFRESNPGYPGCRYSHPWPFYE
jgi:hypothetical protein